MALRDYWKIIKRRWLIMSAIALVIFAASAVSLSLQPKRYEAAASLRVRQTGESYLSQQGEPSLTVLAVTELMKTTYFAKKVKNQIRLALKWPKISEKEQHGLVLSESLTRFIAANNSKMENMRLTTPNFYPMYEVNALQVSTVDTSMERTLVTVNAYIETARAEFERMAIEELQQAREYLEKQLSTYQDKLLDSDKKLRQFHTMHGIMNFDKDMSLRLNRLGDYQVSLEQAALQKEQASMALSLLEKRVPKGIPLPPIPTLLSFEDYRAQLAPLEMELLSLKEKYTENHPKVKRVREQIKFVTQKAKEAALKGGASKESAGGFKDFLTGQMLNYQITLNASSLQEQALKNFVEREQRFLDGLTMEEIKYQALLRNKTTAEKLSNMLSEDLEQINLQTTRKKDVVKIMDRASTAYPISDITIFRFILLAVLSVSIGIFTGVSLDFLDDTIRTADRMARFFHLEPLGTVPAIPETNLRLLTQVGIKSPLAENYSKLSLVLKQKCEEAKAQKILITSSVSGEGKSTMCANLAISLTRAGKTVMLVDADMRHPTQHYLFGFSNTVGFTSILSGELEAEENLQKLYDEGEIGRQSVNISLLLQKALRTTSVENLSLLTSGPTAAHTLGLLTTPLVKQVFQVLSTMADYVIVDSPPVNMVADPGILGGLLDAVVVVVDAGTKKREVSHAKETLTSLKLNMMGFILNRLSAEEEEYYYYYSRYYSPFRGKEEEGRRRQRKTA